MNKEENIIYKRFIELADICYYRDTPVFSDFLDLNEQTVFLGCLKELPSIRYRLDGGFAMAERKIVCFLPINQNEYSLPVKVIKIEPVNIKFAGECTHRDYLGAIMNLGIERSKTGDLIVDGKTCFCICKTEISDYISENLDMVKHTKVKCSDVSLDDIEGSIRYETVNGTVASVRLDSILSVAFKESREHMKNYILSEKVFVNGKCTIKTDYVPVEGDIISVRGTGKLLFEGTGNETKKGRLYVKIKRYV